MIFTCEMSTILIIFVFISLTTCEPNPEDVNLHFHLKAGKDMEIPISRLLRDPHMFDDSGVVFDKQNTDEAQSKEDDREKNKDSKPDGGDDESDADEEQQSESHDIESSSTDDEVKKDKLLVDSDEKDNGIKSVKDLDDEPVDRERQFTDYNPHHGGKEKVKEGSQLDDFNRMTNDYQLSDDGFPPRPTIKNEEDDNLKTDNDNGKEKNEKGNDPQAKEKFKENEKANDNTDNNVSKSFKKMKFDDNEKGSILKGTKSKNHDKEEDYFTFNNQKALHCDDVFCMKALTVMQYSVVKSRFFKIDGKYCYC